MGRGRETAVIAQGASLSGHIDLRGGRMLGITMPSAWTAADLTFSISFDNGATYVDLHVDPVGEVTVPVTAGKYVALYAPDFSAVESLKLRSGTAATPVAQGAARTLYVHYEREL